MNSAKRQKFVQQEQQFISKKVRVSLESCQAAARGLDPQVGAAARGFLMGLNCSFSCSFLSTFPVTWRERQIPQSLNGVWLNRVRLEPLKIYSIHKGDHIQLGMPLENKENAEYEYEVIEEVQERNPYVTPKSDQLMEKNKDLRTKRKFMDELEGPGAEGPSNLKSRISKVSCESGQPVKSHGKGEVASQPSECLDPKLTSVEPSEKTAGAHMYSGPAKVVELHPKKQKASYPLASQNILELFKGLEKEQGEEDLKQQLAQALQEHRNLVEELNHSKKNCEAIIQAKNRELQQIKEEKEKVQAQKEEIFSHLNDVLENELQCIICSEYFVEAVTLNCAHSFCSYCISEWMKRKIECPICRKDIKFKTHSLVLDSCISKMVDNLSSEVKDRRMALIGERKECTMGNDKGSTGTVRPMWRDCDLRSQLLRH